MSTRDLPASLSDLLFPPAEPGVGLRLLAEVEHVAGSGTIGRPHIAQILIEKGYVNGMKDAFERFLGTRGAAYVRACRSWCPAKRPARAAVAPARPVPPALKRPPSLST